MKILKKEMSRKDFIKYSLGSLLLLSLGTIGIKNKKQINNSNISYGKGAYGG